jgi:hypothetical protein
MINKSKKNKYSNKNKSNSVTTAKSRKLKPQTNKTKKSNKKTHTNTHKKNMKSVKKGGFFFSPKNTGLTGQVKKAVLSEDKLINSYEVMSQSVKNYYDKYDNHIKNLISIDDFVNMNSMEKIFKNEIIKKHFKDKTSIDKANPLLLRNYLADGIEAPSGFRKEHLIKQIRYKLYYSFSDRDRNLIDDINIKLVDNESIIMIIRTIENKVYKRNIRHTNYTLDLAQVNRELKTIINNTRQSLGYEGNAEEIQSDSGLGNNLEVENDVEFNSDLIYKGNNNNIAVNKNNNSNSMMKLVNENSEEEDPSGSNVIDIFKELENTKYAPINIKNKQEMGKIKNASQPTFEVPENLKEKLIIGAPTLNQDISSIQSSQQQPSFGQPQPQLQPQQPSFGQPQLQPQQPSFGQQPQPSLNNAEQRCRNINEQYTDPKEKETVCRNTPQCFYNYKRGLCHKNMKQ